MKITDGEKLIILMLSEIYENLEIKGEVEPEFIKSAIFRDHIWSIPWRYSGIPFENQEPPPVVDHVIDILSMWDFIEYSYEELPNEEKERLNEDANLRGASPVFRGFDGNNETKYMSVASFLVNDLDRFERFRGRSMNSHMPSLEIYWRMFSAYDLVRDRLFAEPIPRSDLADILNERIHPENRE